MRDRNYKIDKHEHTNLTVYCPECGEEYTITDISLGLGSGKVPQEEVKCPECWNVYIVEYYLDVQVFNKDKIE